MPPGSRKSSKKNFVDWYFSSQGPVPQELICEQTTSPNVTNTVTYIINYSETPEVFQLYDTTPVNFPNPSSSPTDNVLVSFFLVHNVYNPDNYSCSDATGTPDDFLAIGKSYYVGNVIPIISGSSTYQGPYSVTNRFVKQGITYTIYKTGILQQTYETIGGTLVPLSTKIITENVTGIDVTLPSGEDFICNTVSINNTDVFCSFSTNPAGNNYTFYSLQYTSSALIPRPPRPTPPPQPPTPPV